MPGKNWEKAKGTKGTERTKGWADPDSESGQVADFVLRVPEWEVEGVAAFKKRPQNRLKPLKILWKTLTHLSAARRIL